MERLVELTRGYELTDIWNMDETDCFFKALPKKGLAEKKSQARGGKKSKRGWPLPFLWMLLGKKLSNHWWCGGVKTRVALKTLRVYPDLMAFIATLIWNHEWLQKLWHQFWGKINRQIEVAKRKIVLFMDNAPCCPESLIEQYFNIKVMFLPKKTQLPGSNR